MRIGDLAEQLGTTPHAIRFYEQRGLLPAPARNASGYREYSETDTERVRLLIGLRKLDISLEPAAELASMCAAGRCDEVSDGLRALLIEKREGLARRVDELRYLDGPTSSRRGGSSPRRAMPPSGSSPPNLATALPLRALSGAMSLTS